MARFKDGHDSWRRRISTLVLVWLIVIVVARVPATAQTETVPSGSQAQSNGSQQPEGAARHTDDTVPNPYADAIGEVQKVDDAANVNSRYIGPAVDRILKGEYTNVVFQAAEQGHGNDVQKVANNVLNASLGSINESYRGLHKWFQDDIVGNLFSNIGQLIGKWISEIINGWMADTVQFLAQFLRIFVLNPNIAVNGLNGSTNDGISPYIRQGADVMYAIAVDLLLLLFILCIWKFFTEASYRGAGNLMAPVGRLIATAGLLLAWPTIYAFEVQISNEMIKAIYFDSNDQIAMLHYALASAVKGGVIAAGAAASSVFTPILSNLALGVSGPLVGSVFYFASLVVFLLLGSVLIAEMVYILVLKAIQTALLTAQYLFAPIFLVFFATPDTESIAAGYVRAFVETSLWTFVWVGLLKVMVIIMFSNFNPWGKILIAVGVLQLMIQVPSFLARAQISPMSDFVSAGLVTGGLLKALGGLGGLVSGGLNTLIGAGISKKMTEDLYGAHGVSISQLGGAPGDQEQLESLNKASELSREYDWSKDPKNKDNALDPTNAPPIKNSLDKAGVSPTLNFAVPQTKPDDKAESAVAAATAKPNELSTPANPEAPDSAALRFIPPLPKPKGSSGVGVPSPSSFAKPVTGSEQGTAMPLAADTLKTDGADNAAPNNAPPTAGTTAGTTAGAEPADQYAFRKSNAQTWDEKNFILVDTRKMIGKITSLDGAGIRHNQAETSILGSLRNGVQRINIANGAEGPELARAIFAAAFTENIAHDDPAKDAARRTASEQQAWQPKGFKQGLVANWLESQGHSWYSTPWAKENFHRAMFTAAAQGSQAYVTGQQGNAYTDYLRGRYGEWDEKQDAMGIHLILNPESSESPWNRNIGPATDACLRTGIPIGMDSRGAMQNMTVQAMHPSRQKKAALAVLSYTYDKAKELFDQDGDPLSFALGHGELARSLPANMVQEALAIYESTSSQADLKPEYGSYASGLASASRQDLSTSYQALAMSAPHVAAATGRLRANVDPRSLHMISDLEANIIPAQGESHAQAFQMVMETTSNGLINGEMHNVPMRMLMNRDIGSAVFEFMGSDIIDTNSASAQRKMRVISQNLKVAGTPNDVATLQAIDSVLVSGGGLLRDADYINMARQLMDSGCAAQQLPGAVNMAVLGGYHISGAAVPLDTIVEAAALEEQGVRMTPQKLRLVGRLLQDGVAKEMLPHALDVAVRGGYSNSSSLPSSEIEAVASKFSQGMVSDYRYVPAVAAIINSGEAGKVNDQTARIVAEASVDFGGYQNLDTQYVKALIQVAGALQNPNLAPNITATYVRAAADAQGIDGASSMALNEVVAQLQNSGFDLNSVPTKIDAVQRAGGFSAYQLQDPVAMQMIVENQDQGPKALQAVNVVTRLVGSAEASQKPQMIEVTQEYLNSGGRVRDLDIGGLNAAVEFAAVREAAVAASPENFSANVMQHLRITPQVIRSVSQDMGRSGNQMSEHTWNRFVNEAVSKAQASSQSSP